MHLITTLGSGGAEGMLHRLLIAEVEAGRPRPRVVSLMDEGVHGDSIRAAGITVDCLGMRSGRPSLRALSRLVRLLREERPDVIMTWLYHADLMGLLACLLAGLSAQRVVWNVRCSNMDFSLYAPTTRWVVRALALLSHLPGAVAVNARGGRNHHQHLRYRPRRWVYLPNGFDLDAWRPDPTDRLSVRRELALGEDEFAFGLVARLDPQKDHATFLSAAELAVAQSPDLRFVLMGEHSERVPVPDSIAGRVLALGRRSDVPRLLRGLDATVLSSAYGEGFPNVIGEAMATALPSIVTDVGDAAELVGESGLVVPPSAPKALAGAMLALAREDRATRRQLGCAARRRIQRDFSLDRVVARYRALWDCVASPSPVSEAAWHRAGARFPDPRTSLNE